MTKSIHPSRRCRARLAPCLAAVLLVAGAAMARAQGAPTGTVVGRLTDARNGAPVQTGAVEIEGMLLRTQADLDGRFRLVGVPAGNRVLVVRRIGYALVRRTVAVTAGGETTADIALEPMAVALDQVVVTGAAGGEQRRSLGNAVSMIDAGAELAKSSAPSLSGLLNARASGVVMASSTSRLGAAQAIQVRGRSSLSLENAPLIYVDGVRVSNATGVGPASVGGFAQQNSQVGGRINDINPSDIESIQIVKGPAAATIYGTEAANGVIQIITKKGGSARPSFNFRVQEGSLFFRDAEGRVPTNYMRDGSGNIVAWNGVKQERERGTPLFKTGLTRSYDASFSGGRDVLSYYVSGAYQNDYGIEPNNSLRQFSTHANLTALVGPKVDFQTSLNFVNLTAHLGVDVGASALLGAEMGHGLVFTGGRGFYPNWLPEVPQQLWDNSQGVNRFTGSETITHRPFSWLNHRAIIGIDYTGDDSRALERFAPPELAATLPPSTAAGRIGQTLRHNTTITADYSATATLDVTSALSSATSVGGQFYRTELNTSQLGGLGFPGQGVETVSATAQPTAASQTQILNTTIGAYLQERFGWHDRLFLTAAVRVDNNSAFGDDFKWVTYPKLSAAWVVNEEPFWRNNTVVDALKLRVAYGESGRQPATFAALRTFTPVQGPGGTNAVTPGSIGNSDLRPERGKEIELGFEAGLFRRLSLDFTYFDKRTTDEIVSRGVPPSSGFSGSQLANLGRVDNKGIELQGTYQALQRQNLQWQITANYGTNKDVIRDLGGVPSLLVNAGQFNVVGHPIGGIFTRRVVSADRDPTTNLATNVLCDDGAGGAVDCTTAPFVFIGTPTPKASGAIGNTLTLFNRLTLYALVDFRRGHRVYNSVEQLRCTSAIGVPLCEANYYPERFDPLYLAEAVGTAPARGTIDRYFQNGSFTKLREVSATYAFPDWIRGLSRASLTLAGRELHTWTNYRGPDPEVSVTNPATSSTTQDQAVMPPLTRFIATLNVRF